MIDRGVVLSGEEKFSARPRGAVNSAAMSAAGGLWWSGDSRPHSDNGDVKGLGSVWIDSD